MTFIGFLRGTRPIFAARFIEMSGKPPPIREAVLLKRARLSILPANAATGHQCPGQRAIQGGSPACSL